MFPAEGGFNTKHQQRTPRVVGSGIGVTGNDLRGPAPPDTPSSLTQQAESEFFDLNVLKG